MKTLSIALYLIGYGTHAVINMTDDSIRWPLISALLWPLWGVLAVFVYLYTIIFVVE